MIRPSGHLGRDYCTGCIVEYKIIDRQENIIFNIIALTYGLPRERI